jgi:hypothetical protein
VLEHKTLFEEAIDEHLRRAKWRAYRQLFYAAVATIAVCSLAWIAYHA